MARGIVGTSKGDVAIDRMVKAMEKRAQQKDNPRNHKPVIKKDPFIEKYPTPRGLWAKEVERELDRIKGPVSHYWDRTTGEITWKWVDELWKNKIYPQQAASEIKKKSEW